MEKKAYQLPQVTWHGFAPTLLNTVSGGEGEYQEGMDVDAHRRGLSDEELQAVLDQNTSKDALQDSWSDGLW